MKTGSEISAEWGTGHIVDDRQGYSILHLFFLLYPDILTKWNDQFLQYFLSFTISYVYTIPTYHMFH